ncbi:MAG: glycosyltransferase [Desulfotomaculales bacterium]
MIWLFLLGILALYGLVRLVDDLYRTRSRSPAGPTLLVHVYNQEDTVEDLVRRLLTATRGSQLVVADGGSTDGTWTILSRLALTHGFRLAAGAGPCPCRPPGPVWCWDARHCGQKEGEPFIPPAPISL